MKNIYKYPLELKTEQRVHLDLVQILDIQAQGNIPMLWALVDNQDNDRGAITIYCFGTGSPNVELCKYLDLTYISSTQIENYVWHWFYR